ncbi:MAG: GFA family protein [Pseudomonadota bacterium]
MTETFTGGCLCGAITYRAEAGETLHYLCHCTHCQRFGGAGYHAAIVVAADDLTVHGTPKVFTNTADSGRTIARYFCSDCGGHLFTSPNPEATRFSVKAGTLDDPTHFQPKHEIWRQSKADWIDPDASRELFDQGFNRPVSIGAPAVDPDQDKF